MKTCFKCGDDKPESEFYEHVMMGDGLLGKCKDCTKADSLRRYFEKMQDPAWVEKERERCRLKSERRRKAGFRDVVNPETARQWRINNPEKRKRTAKKWASNNPEKRRAQVKARRALQSGKIHKPDHCHCGSTGELEMHHPDYNFPLIVEWLCTSCHGKTRRKYD